MIDTQYFENIEKGFTVIYGKKPYRVQDDGKGFLHIIVHENGKREKIGIKKLKEKSFQIGSMADYVFNCWFELYDYEQYKSILATMPDDRLCSAK